MIQLSLEGITLHGADVEASITFYTKFPGVSVRVHRPGEFALLQIGEGRLGLLRHGTGQFHIEFETDDLDKAYDALAEAGVPVQGKPSNKRWGERDFLLTDPDGYMLEFGVAWQTRPNGDNTAWSQ